MSHHNQHVDVNYGHTDVRIEGGHGRYEPPRHVDVRHTDVRIEGTGHHGGYMAPPMHYGPGPSYGYPGHQMYGPGPAGHVDVRHTDVRIEGGHGYPAPHVTGGFGPPLERYGPGYGPMYPPGHPMYRPY